MHHINYKLLPKDLLRSAYFVNNFFSKVSINTLRYLVRSYDAL